MWRHEGPGSPVWNWAELLVSELVAGSCTACVGPLTRVMLVVRRNLINGKFVLAAMMVGQAAPALAYIDPNIGGQLYQMLYPVIAVLLGLVTFCRQWLAAVWLRMKTLLRSVISRTSG